MMDVEDIKNLLTFFVKGVYKANNVSKEGKEIMQKCRDLMGMDYVYSVVTNTEGELAGNYPSHLIILEQEKCKGQRPSGVLDNRRLCNNLRPSSDRPRENTQLRELINNAKLARVWSRFPAPVILFEGKNICRSSTLASSAEIMGRKGLNYFFTQSDKIATVESNDFEGHNENDEQPPLSEPGLQTMQGAQGEASGCQAEVRNQDILLLKRLNVNTIIDLMVEKRKVKFGIYVTSSEKVDKENRYGEFTIVSLPYPGCEFFRSYQSNNYKPTNLYFDWTQPYVDATCDVPKDSLTKSLSIKWAEYKTWDLVKLSCNYLRLIVRYIADLNSGILVHCISGWDRTPLFISLLRLSLWADGHIHRSLNPVQMVYLTVAYDWLLFGHNLVDRRGKGEDIMLFCFNFVKFLSSDDFSIPHRRRAADSESSTLGSASLSGSNMSLSSVTSLEQLQLSSDDSHVNGNSCRASPSQSNSPPNDTGEGSSPMPVPSASKLRERNESISSTGSWQFITPTGSYTPNSPMAAFNANGAAELHESTQSTESAGTVTGGEDESQNKLPARTRAERLETVRHIFYNAYWSTVGTGIR